MEGNSSMPPPVNPLPEEAKGADSGEIKEPVDSTALMNQAL
tara:strand:+ start:831 stop:953 length:123 start_codon:yes stop_codon:yes gene_type:complete